MSARPRRQAALVTMRGPNDISPYYEGGESGSDEEEDYIEVATEPPIVYCDDSVSVTSSCTTLSRRRMQSPHDGLVQRNRPRSLNEINQLTFEMIYQFGEARLKQKISEHPRLIGNFYVLFCQQHDICFLFNPIVGACMHLVQFHGCKPGDPEDTIDRLGVLVVGCTRELAAVNNNAVSRAISEGYVHPTLFSPMTEILRVRRKLQGEERSLTRRGRQSQNTANAGDGNSRQVQIYQGVVNPTPGGVYLAYWHLSKGWSAVLVLPLTNLESVGVSGTLESLRLLEHLPACYSWNYQQRSLTWGPGFDDGGEYVTERQFPVMYFDGLKFPERSAVGWVAAEDLREFDVANANSSLIGNIKSVREFLKHRGDQQAGLPSVVENEVNTDIADPSNPVNGLNEKTQPHEREATPLGWSLDDLINMDVCRDSSEEADSQALQEPTEPSTSVDSAPEPRDVDSHQPSKPHPPQPPADEMDQTPCIPFIDDNSSVCSSIPSTAIPEDHSPPPPSPQDLGCTSGPANTPFNHDPLPLRTLRPLLPLTDGPCREQIQTRPLWSDVGAEMQLDSQPPSMVNWGLSIPQRVVPHEQGHSNHSLSGSWDEVRMSDLAQQAVNAMDNEAMALDSSAPASQYYTPPSSWGEPHQRHPSLSRAAADLTQPTRTATNQYNCPTGEGYFQDRTSMPAYTHSQVRVVATSNFSPSLHNIDTRSQSVTNDSHALGTHGSPHSPAQDRRLSDVSDAYVMVPNNHENRLPAIQNPPQLQEGHNSPRTLAQDQHNSELNSAYVPVPHDHECRLPAIKDTHLLETNRSPDTPARDRRLSDISDAYVMVPDDHECRLPAIRDPNTPVDHNAHQPVAQIHNVPAGGQTQQAPPFAATEPIPHNETPQMSPAFPGASTASIYNGTPLRRDTISEEYCHSDYSRGSSSSAYCPTPTATSPSPSEQPAQVFPPQRAAEPTPLETKSPVAPKVNTTTTTIMTLPVFKPCPNHVPFDRTKSFTRFPQLSWPDDYPEDIIEGAEAYLLSQGLKKGPEGFKNRNGKYSCPFCRRPKLFQRPGFFFNHLLEHREYILSLRPGQTPLETPNKSTKGPAKKTAQNTTKKTGRKMAKKATTPQPRNQRKNQQRKRQVK